MMKGKDLMGGAVHPEGAPIIDEPTLVAALRQGLGNVLIDGEPERKTGRRIRCCPRLGGLLNYYERVA